MAKLNCHGIELDRREYPGYRVAVMSDGNLLRNSGNGWKLWKKLLPSVDPAEYAARKRREYDAKPLEFRLYLQALDNAISFGNRAQLHLLITLMPEDGDGVYSEFNDCHYSDPVDLDDVWACCRAYQAATRTERAA